MLGYDLESFWQQTPRTLEIAFDAHAEIEVKEHNERAWMVWHIAALQRQKKLTPLRKMQVSKDQVVKRRKTMDEQIEGLIQYVQRTGGKVIYHNG